jgi:hypothetical protein
MRLNAKKFLKKNNSGSASNRAFGNKKIVLPFRRKPESRILNPGFRAVWNDGFQRFFKKINSFFK